MDTNFMLLIVSWLALAATLVPLMVFRRHTFRNEDEFLHVSHAAGISNSQAATAHQTDVPDDWVTILPAAALVYGLGIGAWFLYQIWQANSKLVS